MPALKLTYFPIAGRSFPIKVACELKNVPIEFETIPFDAWFGSDISKDRQRFPLGNIPVLNVDGQVLCESTVIWNYIGNLTGLWPTDALGSARALEVLACIEHIFTGGHEHKDDCNLVASMQLQGEAQEKARKGPVTDRIKFYLARANEIVGKDGYSVGGKLSIVDIWLVYFLAGVQHKHFDHIDPAIISPFTNLHKISATLFGDDKLKAIMEKHLQ